MVQVVRVVAGLGGGGLLQEADQLALLLQGGPRGAVQVSFGAVGAGGYWRGVAGGGAAAAWGDAAGGWVGRVWVVVMRAA